MITVLLTVVEALGYLGIVAGLLLLVLTSGGGRAADSTTYWYDGQPISRAEYELLLDRDRPRP